MAHTRLRCALALTYTKSLFDRYWEPVFKFCYYHLGDWHAAEDAAGDVFVKALANLDHFDPSLPGTTFRSWLFGITRHVVGSSHRYAARHPQTVLDDTFVDHTLSPEEWVLASEEHERLRSLLNELPADQRALLDMRLAGLSAVEIGRTLGRSQDAVRKAQSRVVIGLRDAVQRQEMLNGSRHG